MSSPEDVHLHDQAMGYISEQFDRFHTIYDMIAIEHGHTDAAVVAAVARTIKQIEKQKPELTQDQDNAMTNLLGVTYYAIQKLHLDG